MVPDPLHPAVVHFPIALAVLIPAVAVLCVLSIRRGWIPPAAWLGVVVLQALLVTTAWLAVETGEHEEERVERVVAEQAIEEHEEAAERFLILTGLALLVGASGLVPGEGGAWGRRIAVVAMLGVLGAAAVVGHRGGQLVYEQGAASAYVPARTGGAGEGSPWSLAGRGSSHSDHDEDHDDD